ncbi:MAG TPA: transposase [Acidimicrobiales bacterium]|nr:transposase [Acidimicrobiales bacterium]
MDAREQRGMQIAATTRLRKGKAGWLVPSQSGVGTYKVTETPRIVAAGFMGGMECTCPDFELRGLPCKHVFAVEYVSRRENPDGSVLTESVRVTYTQDWTAYNAAQCAEKETFLPMLADLCSALPNPPQGRGRPRMPMSDMAFACVLRVYEGFSARRFDTDVRQAKAAGLTEVDPHFNTVLRYLRSPEMTDALTQLVVASALPLKAVETDFAVDSTGFTTSRFERWYDHKWGKERSRHEWVKLHAMTGVRTNIVTAVEISGGHSNDTNYFRPTLATTAENFQIREVSADKAYSSKANLRAVDELGAVPYVPFRGALARQGPAPQLPGLSDIWVRMYHLFAYQRDTFLSRYHQRSNVETTFSMIKRKFGDSLRSKSEAGQMNEILCKVIAHNLCVLIASIHELGLDVPTFAAIEAG